MFKVFFYTLFVHFDNLVDVWVDFWFDLKYQLDTFKKKDIDHHEINHPSSQHAKKYQGTRVRVFNRIMKALKYLDHEQYNFIDLGSGKGRTLILASAFPFKQLIGLEFSRSLCEVANQNLVKMKLDHRASCYHQNILNFVAPKGPNLYYLYNPFNENILHDVFNKLIKNKEFSPGDLIVYLNPRYHHILDQLNLKRTILIRDHNYNKVVLVYTL